MHTHQITMANNVSSSSPSSPQSSYNSSFGSNSGQKLIINSNSINSNNSSPIAALVPGGVVTTQNISTVIRPKSNNNSLQFVKIQTPELSKTAVEQIKLAEETKISKDKVKEVEEEWQNNLLNWKSKRRQQITQTFEQAPTDPFDTTENGSGRKIKTFAEMIEQRAKSGNRLGFHLQRYLGSEDDEETEEVANPSVVHDDEQNNNNNNSQPLDHPSKSRVDSDCEIHSSTSSGYNQLDSKGSSSPDTPLEQKPPTSEVLATPRQTSFLKCDSVSSNSPRNEPQQTHSISLVEASQPDILNSTLLQEAKPSPLPPNQLYRSSTTKNHLDGSTRTIEISARSEDESDELGSEEEEQEQEEEEEQKHLQRIAFEAKLKAFEKLTNASVAKPVIAPKRHVRPSFTKPTTPTQQHQHHQQQQQQPSPVSPPPPPQPKKQIIPPNPICSDQNESTLPSPIARDARVNVPLSQGEVVAPIPPAVMRESFPSSGQIISELDQLNLDQQVYINNNNISPDGYSPSKVKPPAPQYPLGATSPPKERLSPIKSDRLSPIKNDCVSPINNSNLPRTHSGDFTGSQNSIPTPTKPELQPRKPVKEDKDRSILSVSGKKRCSSCKEELGRGAAAFVVESLSLVYHTNCFRCSVCHVNLSNGFRGVDVRVHAGALHCQNCYSKDGLNYSRV